MDKMDERRMEWNGNGMEMEGGWKLEWKWMEWK